ncbi:hypothetical protein M0802_003006 [Mischocyttarus mexicanus]|nr:hypothetical protein M0802_003006 [Mischocyttarus mexicanus]
MEYNNNSVVVSSLVVGSTSYQKYGSRSKRAPLSQTSSLTKTPKWYPCCTQFTRYIPRIQPRIPIPVRNCGVSTNRSCIVPIQQIWMKAWTRHSSSSNNSTTSSSSSSNSMQQLA